MGWKKVAESKDLIILEKNLKSYKLKIEARKNKQSVWEIFKTKIDGESSDLLSEYTIKDSNQLNEVLEKLKETKADTNIKETVPTIIKTEISIKRAFKEDFVEKWFFSLDEEKNNFIIVRFDKAIDTDIVMNEKYKEYEKEILNQIEDKLGLKDLGDIINYNIFYFNEKKQIKEDNSEEEYNYNIHEFGLENHDEDSI